MSYDGPYNRLRWDWPDANPVEWWWGSGPEASGAFAISGNTVDGSDRDANPDDIFDVYDGYWVVMFGVDGDGNMVTGYSNTVYVPPHVP